MARNATLFLNQDKIQAILEVCADVQAVENKIYSLLTSGKCKDNTLIIKQHLKYNHGLALIHQLIRMNLGKAVVPSMIVQTIESGGPRFIQLDPRAIATSLKWSPSGLFEFSKLRNETISLWSSINGNIIHATVEVVGSVLNESVME